MTITVVNADKSHSRDIWEWRNDPISRSFSRNKEEIEWDEHQTWFEKSLTNPKKFLYVGISIESNKMPMGIIRFDLIDPKKYFYEVSINISPIMRGKGIGRFLLNYGTQAFNCEVKKCNRIYAEVKTDNLSSILLFTSAGYTPYENNHKEFTKYFIDCD
tara:strand:+ start:278 stop:754 length:477 start_codon:yes stop_codon:yes gene_type:complete